MGHVPNIGKAFGKRENVLADVSGPQAEVLGTIKDSVTEPQPSERSASWQSESGEQITFVEPPPPWEVTGSGIDESDARLFVDVPKEWTLRWINPKLLDQSGWRYWQPVMASDPRVKVKVKSMVSVENNIRRGGQTGDILGWMYTTWVDSRRQERIRKSYELAESARDKQERLAEEMKRGTYGQFIRFDSAKHPTHTMGEGRTMRD